MPLASSLPASPSEPPREWMAPLRMPLTVLCGVFLALSILPGLSVLALAAVAFGLPFALESAWGALRERKLDVNFLMVLAAAGAVAVGRGQDAAVLLFLFSLSTLLESLAMARTRSAIDGLVRLRPSTALRVRDGVAESVPVESLVLGDLVRVPSFESIPTDGQIVEGASSVDTSAMTGESVPVSCGTGDPVVGGTQNLDGALLVRVTAVVGDSALDRVVDLVRDAQENKASGERISAWFGQRYTLFVLAAFAVSLAVRLLAGQAGPSAFYSSLTLLVGLSPCALVISTPATTLSALTWCARNGILVRGGEAIERAGTVRVVALDKTGTLTEGRPSLTHVVLSGTDGSLVSWESGNAMSEEVHAAVAFAAAAEGQATHPLAAALARAVDQAPPAMEYRVVPGLGVTAVVDGADTLVGRKRLLTERGVVIPAELQAEIGRMQSAGMTVSLFSRSGCLAAFGFSDAVREGAREFVEGLRRVGIRQIVLLTGDRRETAEAVAHGLGLDTVRAGLMPGDKTGEIERLSEGGGVMMVGDGVNDAPSLAAASVGVAMGGLGSDVALNAADVVLMRDRLASVVDLVRLGRRTSATVRFNLLFAGGVIAVLAFTSLSGRLPLPLAVVGHEGSTVLVILNGLRMLWGPGAGVPKRSAMRGR